MPEWANSSQVNALVNRLGSLLAFFPPAKIRQCLYVGIVVALLSMLADIVWLLVPVPSSDSVAASAAGMPVAPLRVVRPQVDIQSMQNWNLFGSGDARPAAEEVSAEQALQNANDAAQTSLQLTLSGIMYSNVPDEGFAVIDFQGVSGLYKVGDDVPGGGKVKLAKVLVDRVIIDNNGRAESILLYTETPLGRAPSPDQGVLNQKTVDQRSNAHLSNMANNYRNQLLSNPMSFADIIKVSVAKDADGKLLGYRIRPGNDRQQFADFGLMSGDIVTAINGVQLDDPAKAMELYGQLREATEASVVVRRGTEEINLILGLSR